MSTTKYSDDLPIDPDDEQLVAYLDGELDRSERAELETRLIDDDRLRVRLQQLQVGWDLLGELEAPESSFQLVESTLELAVADIKMASSSRGRSWLGRFRWQWTVLCACLIGVASTLVVASLVKSRQYQRQLKDLAIVENLDAYLYGSDIALMRQLGSDKDWVQMVDASSEIGYDTSAFTKISSAPIAQREAIIADLPLEKRAELKSRWERFKLFDIEKRDRIRHTADLISEQPDAVNLLNIMNAYAIWRETIQPPELRDQIESTDLSIRTQAIAQAVGETQRAIAERASYMLDEATVERIYMVLRQFVRQRVREGDEITKRGFEQLVAISGREKAIDQVLAITVLRGETLGEYRPKPLTESELKWVRVVLSDAAVQKLDGIAGGFQPIETMTLRIWAEEAVRRRYRQTGSDSTIQRYKSLDPAEREVLDLLPPHKILEKLTE